VVEHNSKAIVPVASDHQKYACALLMSNTEPWITLGRSFEDSLAIFNDPEKECFCFFDEDELLGFLVIDLHGPFRGYIQSVCTIPSKRGSGLGSRLIGFAEERIFQVSPNAFICVSDFNSPAQRLYQKLGYEVIGELKGFIIAGHSEILMRKTIGPLRNFIPGKPNVE